MTENEAQHIIADLKASNDYIKKKLDELELLIDNLLKEKEHRNETHNAGT